MEMKIVSWNCHYGFSDEKYEHIKKFNPDILIVQESTKNDFDRIKKDWSFKNWYNDDIFDEKSDLGIAIFSKNHEIKFTENFNRNYRYVIPYEIHDENGRLFYLFAVWTKENGAGSYETNVMKAVKDNLYSEYLEQPAMIIGDYNTFNEKDYDKMEKSLANCKLINCVENEGVKDKYLKYKPTFSCFKDRKGVDDFCFVSEVFNAKYCIDLEVDDFSQNISGENKYKGLSDHVPLTVTITENQN